MIRTPLTAAAAGLVLAIAWATGATQAAEPVDLKVVADVRQLLTALDAQGFAEREAAASRLAELAKDAQVQPVLARELELSLLARETSFEVRARVTRLLNELPAAAAAKSPLPKADEIDPLIEQLSSDRSAERDGAQRQLAAMLTHVELVAPMLLRVKQRLTDTRLSLETRRGLEAVLDKAREAWVTGDPAAVQLPAVSRQQMDEWLGALAGPEPVDLTGRLRRELAHGELIDLLVRDDTRDELLKVLNERIGATTDAAAVSRLQEIADFAKPAMAAEVWGHQEPDNETGQTLDWNHRQHRTVQHLLIGVPQMAEGALRATHFDRIDDQTAHCVSGNSLEPGDYAVGLAIPFPRTGDDVMFHLVNLPTPRRRLAYGYYLRRDESERLLDISRRTLEEFLAKRHALNEAEVMMLCHLDPRAVSRFVGPYFQAVPDRPLSATTAQVPGAGTMHSTICMIMSMIGTQEAVPALEKIARANPGQKLNYENPFSFAWIGALAIARRDPWPDVDTWLAGLIDETEPVISNADPAPDLGSTAAGLLLERHEVSPYAFDLEPAGTDTFERSAFVGYRFMSDSARQEVKAWWTKKQAASQKTSP